jgi:hypothetical protein
MAAAAAVVDLTLLPDDDEDDIKDIIPPVSRTYHVLLLGDPVPKPSPRCYANFHGFSPTNKPIIHRWTRNPAKPKMNALAETTQNQLHAQNCTSFPVIKDSTVWIRLWFCKRPNNTYFINNNRTRPKGHLLDRHPYTPIMCPDTDNCVKFVLDALSKVAWKDDNQVAMITACKCLDANPPYEGRTIIEFGVLDHVMEIPEWAK